MALSTKQKILLDLMVRCDKIMAEHDIKYFLFGGSTLGALRHGGFIPWDDDIDIIMDAENYYKLEEVFHNGPVDKIDLAFFHNDPNWYRPFAMLVNLVDTSYTPPSIYSSGKAVGSRIDVMICDYVPTDRLEEYRHELMLYEEVMSDSLIADIDVYKVKDEYYALRERMEEIGKPALEKDLRDKLESYATGAHDELVVRFWTKELRHYDRDIIYPPLYVDFEGYKLPVPAKPEEQMRLQFGNDWYVIPTQDQYMQHPFTDNYYISGINYHEDIMNFIDRDKAEQEARERKALLLERAPYAQRNNAFRANMTFQREMMRARIDEKEGLFAKLLKEEKYLEYYNELKSLLMATKSAAIVEKEHKNIPTQIMKGWLLSCINCGRYYEAVKLADAYEIRDEDYYKEELDLLDRVINLANAYQDNDEELMRSYLNDFDEKERAIIPDVIYAEAKLQRDNNGRYGNDADSILTKCNEYIKKIPNNYEMLKLKADIEYEKGYKEKAKDIYEIVHEKTNNGFDLRYIEARYDFPRRFDKAEQDPFDEVMGGVADNDEIIAYGFN